MPRPKSKAPARRYHVSGQSVVTINGRDYYLGPHDSPESIARYAVLINLYQSGDLRLPDDFDLSSLDEQVAAIVACASPAASTATQPDAPMLVRHVTAAYRELAKTKYADSPQEKDRADRICDQLDEHDGNVIANDYGPLRLQAQRQRWVDAGLSRGYCNRLTKFVIRIWKHAVSQELVSETSWRRLKSVESLREGQTTAPETAPGQTGQPGRRQSNR